MPIASIAAQSLTPLTIHEQIECPKCGKVQASCGCPDGRCDRFTRAITCRDCASREARKQ